MSGNRLSSPLEEVRWIGQLADMKEHLYQQGLLLDAIIELLIEKELLTAQEIAAKAKTLEQELI